MLSDLGEVEASRRIRRAIETVLTAGKVRPPDLGGTAGTHDMTEAIVAAMDGAKE